MALRCASRRRYQSRRSALREVSQRQNVIVSAGRSSVAGTVNTCGLLAGILTDEEFAQKKAELLERL